MGRPVPRRPGGRGAEVLFLAARKNRNGDRPYSDGRLRDLLGELARRLDVRDAAGGGLVDFQRTHRFRHTRATRLPLVSHLSLTQRTPGAADTRPLLDCAHAVKRGLRTGFRLSLTRRGASGPVSQGRAGPPGLRGMSVLNDRVPGTSASSSDAARWGPGGLAGLLNGVLAGLGGLYVSTGSVAITVLGSLTLIILAGLLLLSGLDSRQ